METPQDKSPPCAGLGSVPYTCWRSGQALQADRSAGQPIGGTAGAPPSNTAPANYTEPPLVAQVVGAGLDSLYLSYWGELRPHWASQLESKRVAAQSRDTLERSTAQVEVSGSLFRVEPRGFPGFRYVLQGDFFQIKLSTSESGGYPLANVKIASELLWQSHLDDVLTQLGSIVQTLGLSTGQPGIHRADITLDFVPSCPVSGLDDLAWICRSDKVNRYSENGVVSGWTFGQGGDISARLYDKTLEIKKSHKEFFLALWSLSGWDGESDVWRLEYQLRRPALRRFDIGIPDRLREHLESLWCYCTSKWLRLAIPSGTDTNQSRWPTAPLWESLQSFPSLDEFTQRQIDLSVKPKAPSLAWLFSQFVGVLTSYMTVMDLSGSDAAVIQLLREARAYFDAKGSSQCSGFQGVVEGRIRDKNRRFNLRLNPGASDV